MTTSAKPATRPARALFSSGPCAKRPGWTPEALKNTLAGRSHRSAAGKARLKLAIDKTKALLRLPADFHVAIMPGSDTGAFEMAMWNLLGTRGVDVLAWESFGKIWVTDIVKQLRLPDVRTMEADFGKLPDLSAIDFNRDVVLTANGTTAGVKVPSYDFVPLDRKGLVLVDATSAIFAQPVDWSKVDVLTYSWQKVLGGEAAHGMLIMGPRAVERLEATTPPWPLPKLFRMTKGGKLDAAIFEGETINTPSMLCVEDYLDALAWAESVGGLEGLHARANANAAVLHDWIARTPWIENLALDKATWSNTAVCMRFVVAELTMLSAADQAAFAKSVVALLEREGVGFDLGSYRDAPPGLRIWTGSTVEKGDLEALLPWIEWAFAEARSKIKKAA